ncbi:MAG: elongation factor P [Candidatus Omnitrophica bacterium CG11_big_fil_rev_8_21_14_0_20_42_13]|uniref:Elongation factor P n=1 Tax=Candidatus Ghiorseimicrobium undicola TaxID=1974746 RepID=A0A2H0M205_9BACT|nr:MAG: elongation factor P [Candidatus Omnitrophica bacterium CG11_big_fil_rev_8_21_14_0_20_42_13]
MALSINECKTGLTVLLDGQVFLVIEVHHVKPGKGAAFIRTRLKNLKLGTVIERTFKSNESIEQAYIEEKKLQFQYNSHDMYHFMDMETFEESILTREQLGDNISFLKDNLEVTAYFHNNELVNVVMPNFIECTVIETEPGIRGDTAKATLKPAKIETGAVISVPLFINAGDRIKIDTRSAQYIERA